jgi:hypothetical protein
MYAVVDDRRRGRSLPPPVLTQTVTQAMNEEMGPHLPKNPYRR